MRVIVDTNVLVSGLLFGGPPREILELVQTDTITLCMTETAILELNRVLTYPKLERQRLRLTPRFEIVLDDVLSRSIRIPEPLDAIDVITVDPSDNIFLACASAANAQFIISGDKHLLDVKNFAGIPIVTPRQFLRQFK